jgi:hypothetical protein
MLGETMKGWWSEPTSSAVAERRSNSCCRIRQEGLPQAHVVWNAGRVGDAETAPLQRPAWFLW